MFYRVVAVVVPMVIVTLWDMSLTSILCMESSIWKQPARNLTASIKQDMNMFILIMMTQ